MCEREEIDVLLIAGDLFHRQPLLRELKEVNSLFESLTKTRVVAMAGNHDYIKSDSYYRTFEWSENVYFFLEEEMDWIEFKDIGLCVSGLSYYRKEITEHKYEGVKAFTKMPYHILLAHGGDEKHIPIQRQNLLDLGYDYVALGHIHRPTVLAEDRIIYSGALEPIDKNDIGPHGYVQGELTKEGIRTWFVPFAKREYVHLDVEVNDRMTGYQLCDVIRREITERGIQNIYKVTLRGFRDSDILFDTAGMDVFGNIIEFVDQTNPSYDFEKLWQKNRDNLLGQYIESLWESESGSVEYRALYEGVQALLETKRG